MRNLQLGKGPTRAAREGKARLRRPGTTSGGGAAPPNPPFVFFVEGSVLEVF